MNMNTNEYKCAKACQPDNKTNGMWAHESVNSTPGPKQRGQNVSRRYRRREKTLLPVLAAMTLPYITTPCIVPNPSPAAKFVAELT